MRPLRARPSLSLLALPLLLTLSSCSFAAPQPVRAVPAAAGERLLAAAMEKSTAGDTAGARSSFEAALAAFGAVSDRRGEARVRKELGTLSFSAGNLAEAGVQYQQGLAAAREARDRDLEARLLNNLGLLAQEAQEKDKAQEFFQQSLAISEQDRNEGVIALALANLADVDLARGDSRSALGRLERAAGIVRRLGPAPVAARVLITFAKVYDSLGDTEESASLWQEAVPYAHATKNKVGETAVLLGLGLALQKNGQIEQAATPIRQALEIARDIADAETEGAALTALAVVYEKLGDSVQEKETARSLLQLATKLDNQGFKAIAERHLGAARSRGTIADDAAQESLTLAQALAMPELELIALAERVFAQDLAEDWTGVEASAELLSAKATAAGDDLYLGVALKEKSAAALQQGDAARAVDHLKKSVEAFARAGDSADAYRGNALESLGAALFQIGDIPGALAAYASMGETYRKAGDRRMEALALQLQALVAFDLGDSLGGEKLLATATELGRSFEDRELQLQGLFALGVMSWDDKPRLALESFEKYIELIRTPGSPLTATLDRRSEMIALGFLARASANLDEPDRALNLANSAVAAAEANGEDIDRALARDHRAYVHFRAGRLQPAEADARAAIDLFEKEEAKLGNAELAKVGAIDRETTLPDLLQQVLIREGKPAEALAASERRRARVFSETLAGHPIASPSPDSLAQIVRALGVTVIEYSILYEPGAALLPGRSEGLQPHFEKELYIWVIRPDGEVDFRSVDLRALHENSEPLNGKISYLLRHLESTRSKASELEPLLRDLYGLLIAPVAGLLPIDPHAPVVVVPHGTLFQVPFAALTDPAGRPLIRQHTLITAPSIVALAGLRRPGAPPDTWRGAGALIVGNPRTSARAGTLPPLPSAEEEARSVAAAFGAGVLVGEQATESEVTRALPGARLVHFATHGLSERGGSRLLPGALAFAPSGEADDGLLTAGEIRSLHLTADLVVLSACRTAQGRITGDGVIGLSRSFLAAGAAGVVTSLWKIDDEATSALMLDFYRQLRASGDPATALRAAMLGSIQRGESPRIWGAFTYLGAPSSAKSP